jgi:hypothetical protein
LLLEGVDLGSYKENTDDLVMILITIHNMGDLPGPLLRDTVKTRVSKLTQMTVSSQPNRRTTLRLCQNRNPGCIKLLMPTLKCMTLGCLRLIIRKWFPRGLYMK